MKLHYPRVCQQALITFETVRLKKTVWLITLLWAFAGSGAARQLPSVLLKDINGKTVDTSVLRNEGKPFIISFFAMWCKPCLRELEAIHDVYADWRAETGVRLIAVSIDEAQDALKVGPAVKASGWEYDFLLDTNSDFMRAMGIRQIPAVFVIDGNGNIAFSRTGYTAGSEEHLIEEVRRLITIQ